MLTIYMRGVTLITVILLCSLPVQTRGDVAIPDCSAQVVELAPCLSYVSDQEPSPTQSCCDALQTVVMKASVCLCELVGRGKNGTMGTGLPPLNYTLVRELPKDCGVQSEVHKDEALCRGSNRKGGHCEPIADEQIFGDWTKNYSLPGNDCFESPIISCYTATCKGIAKIRVHEPPAPAPYPYDPAGSTGSPLLVSSVLLLVAWSVISTSSALLHPSAVLSPPVYSEILDNPCRREQSLGTFDIFC